MVFMTQRKARTSPQRSRRRGAWLSVFAALSACAAPGTYVPPLDGAPAAVLIGQSSPLWSNPSPFGVIGKTRFRRVDDDALARSAWSGYPSEVRLAPGQHYVEVEGEVRMDGRSLGHGREAFVADFEAGKVYCATVRLNQRIGAVVFDLEELPEQPEAAAPGHNPDPGASSSR